MFQCIEEKCLVVNKFISFRSVFLVILLFSLKHLSRILVLNVYSEGMFLIIVFKSRFSVVLCSRKHAI